MRPNTDTADYNVRLKKAIQEISKNNRIKVTISLRGREMQFKDQGLALMERFVEDVGDIAKMETRITMTGNMIICALVPNKDTSD